VALTRVAIRRARARHEDVVGSDDLLIAALGEVSRFGIALIGPWAIDVTALDGVDPVPEQDLPPLAPRYGDDAVALFEEAARIAADDGSPAVGLIHVLVALGSRPGQLFLRMSEEYGIDLTAWRTALARGQVGPAPREAVGGAGGHADAWVAPASDLGSPTLLSVDDAASVLDVHAQTVRNYIRGGKLAAYRLGGERSIRVLRRDLMALLEPVDAEDDETDVLELPITLFPKEN
jgi:excisionase family DNA binding protein